MGDLLDHSARNIRCIEDQANYPPLNLYEGMLNAIAKCEQVDEVKDVHDKAMALEAYYKQARNKDAENKAANIRLRAERRAGELLKELARAEAPNPTGTNQHEVKSTPKTQPKSPYASALSETGISRQTANQFQKVANVPEAVFEAALSGEDKPSRRKILHPPPPQMEREPLWVWGRIKDFHRDGILQISPSDLTHKMTDPMRAEGKVAA